MTTVVLFLLVILWVVVLFPPWWKSRNSRGNSRTIRSDGFSLSPNRPDTLQALNNVLTPGAQDTVVPFRRPAGGGQPVQAVGAPSWHEAPVQTNGPVADEFFGPAPSGFDLGTPMSRESARRRRRNVLVALFAVSALNLGLALVFQSVFTLLFLVSLAVLLGFVMLVVQHERANEERRNKVRPIRPPGRQVPLQAAPSYLVRESAN